jgi:hypothetical protein
MLDFFPWVNPPPHACWNQGFFPGFCNVAKVGNHQENDFAKFGDIIDMKVEKKGIFLYSWLPSGSYHKTGNLEFLKIWNLGNLGHFSHEKSFE